MFAGISVVPVPGGGLLACTWKLNKNKSKNNIITKLYKNHINFHLLIDDFFYDNENILFNKQINTFSNNGFLFENNFTNNVIYHNNFYL